MTDTKSALLDAVVGGAAIKFREPEIGQLALVSHQAKVLTRNDVTKEQGQRALSLVYRAVMSWIPGPDDKATIEDMIADGDILVEDVLRSLMAAARAQREADEAEEKPVVRRGRPRKSA